MNIGEAVERLRRSTVQILAEGGSRGSGFLIKQDGSVVTNAHVVGKLSTVRMELWDGREVPGKVLLTDPARDLAWISAGTGGTLPARFREQPARPGEPVIAVGNPLGFSGAMTRGFVKAVGPLPRLGRRIWVQSAIRLAPGNSGGPLADAQGDVLGMNTMVAGGGLALAIPVAAIQNFLGQGAAPRLGITAQPVAGGLLILSIESASAAEQASLLMGDLLTHINGHPIVDGDDLLDQMSQSRGIARIRFVRAGRTREVAVVIPAGRHPGVAA